MVLFWASTPCASMQPSLDESRESSDNPQGKQNRTNINVLRISFRFNNLMKSFWKWVWFKEESEGRLLTDERRSWGWRRVISYWAMWKLLITLKGLIYGCCDRCHIPLGRRGSAESHLTQAWLTWPVRTNLSEFLKIILVSLHSERQITCQ